MVHAKLVVMVMPNSPDIFSTMLFVMIPVGAMGENAAPSAAPTTRRVMAKALSPIRSAKAMHTGAMRTTVGMFPGPAVVIAAMRK